MISKILVADDEPHIRLLLGRILEEFEDEGIEIHTANDGFEALEVIKTEQPELVFLDVMMPKINGFDVCHEIKRVLELENIFIESPKANTLIQGGTMRVSGLARLRSTQPLRIEILTNDGRIVGTRQVSVTPTPGSAYGTFAIDVPYSIDYTSKVRLQIWVPGERIPGPVNLSSLEVILSP